MSHFAEIDEDDMVIRVLKCTQDEINNSGLYGDPSRWIQTSYNTYAGKHYNPETGEEDDNVEADIETRTGLCNGPVWLQILFFGKKAE